MQYLIHCLTETYQQEQCHFKIMYSWKTLQENIIFKFSSNVMQYKVNFKSTRFYEVTNKIRLEF